MSSAPGVSRRWSSLYGRWYLRHAALVYVLARLALTMGVVWVLANGGTPLTAAALVGGELAGGVVLIHAGALWFDRAPRAVRTLMANLGFTSVELLVVGAVVALSGEAILVAVVR